MRLGLKLVTVSVALVTALFMAGTIVPPAKSTVHRPATAPLSLEDIQPTEGQRWLASRLDALDEPVPVELPFVGTDLGVAGPVAVDFRAAAGQKLEIGVQPEATDLPLEGGPYIEVFRVVDVLGRGLYERLSAMPTSASALRTRLPSDGTYRVLVDARAPLSRYRMTLELSATLPFPVVGADASAVRSHFGASRDDGRRSHEGIDIFAARLTPVLAVAAGTVKMATERRGGNTVWLDTPGVSYYYAHLDRVATRTTSTVRAGDILGYIGNTGNASRTPSHLHFGVYRYGRVPVDPLPLIAGRKLERAPTSAAPATTHSPRQAASASSQ